MVAIRLERFGGMVPVLGRRLLPDMAATSAVNVNLVSGEMRPIQLPASVQTFASTVLRAFRIPDPAAPGVPVWITATSRFARFFPSPLVNDSFNRFIWLDGNAPGTAAYPVVNSFQRIKDGNAGADAPIRLGVPRPAAAPALVVTGGVGANVTRSYVYTFVNLFGEEGQPSDPVTVTDNEDGSWDLSGMSAPPAGRGVTAIHVYRTVTGSGGVTLYYRVAVLGVVTTYSDVIPDATVLAAAIVLASTSWAEAPQMEGMAQMPGGFLVGWNGRDLYFSEPYRTWAWPVEYQISTTNKIVGCGVHGESLVVLTEGKPAVVTGQRPSALSITTVDSPEPCLSPNAIVSSPEGVFFAGEDGIMNVTSGGAVNVTKNLIDETQWRTTFRFANMSLVRVSNSLLLAFSTAGAGYILDLSNERTALQLLANFETVDSAWEDLYNGQVYLMALDSVWQWAPDAAPFTVGRWESKEYHFRKPLNFGALKVFYDTSQDLGDPAGDSIITQPGDPVDGGPWLDQAAIPNYCIGNSVYANQAPDPGTLPPGAGSGADGFPFWFGLEPNFVVAPVALALPSGVAVYIELWADGVLRWASVVENDVQYRPASGFKAAVWKVVLLSRVPVMAIHLAETPKELANA